MAGALLRRYVLNSDVKKTGDFVVAYRMPGPTGGRPAAVSETGAAIPAAETAGATKKLFRAGNSSLGKHEAAAASLKRWETTSGGNSNPAARQFEPRGSRRRQQPAAAQKKVAARAGPAGGNRGMAGQAAGGRGISRAGKQRPRERARSSTPSQNLVGGIRCEQGDPTYTIKSLYEFFGRQIIAKPMNARRRHEQPPGRAAIPTSRPRRPHVLEALTRPNNPYMTGGINVKSRPPRKSSSGCLPR